MVLGGLGSCYPWAGGERATVEKGETIQQEQSSASAKVHHDALQAWDEGDESKSRLAVTVACRGLKLPEQGSGSRVAVIYMQDDTGTPDKGLWKEVGSTEVCHEAAEPVWVTPLEFDYNFEKNQMLRFSVYHVQTRKFRTLEKWKSRSSIMKKASSPIVGENGSQSYNGSEPSSERTETHENENYELIGYMDINIHQIAGSLGCQLERRLKLAKGNSRHQFGETAGDGAEPEVHPRGRSPGVLVLQAEEMSHVPYTCSIGLRVEEIMGRGSPKSYFARVSRSSEGGVGFPVYRTEVASAELCWRDFRISFGRLCNGDLERLIHIDLYVWKASGRHTHCGRWSGSVGWLKENMLSKTFEDSGEDMSTQKERGRLSMRGRRRKNKAWANKVCLTVQNCLIEKKHSFLEFIQGGCEIGLIVGIDFTASNGDPRSPQSLHYMYGEQPNVYQTAIRSVCGILSHYDSDNLYPAFGFGAKFSDSSVQHCFSLNGNPANNECEGVEGIMDAYRNALHSVALHGPTKFAPMLRAARKVAERDNSQENQHYEILLIITDGMISDMEATKRELYHAQYLPLSVIIVGVGDADFSQMIVLDGDDNKLSVDGMEFERDIVQFVPFQDFHGKHVSLLTREVLREVPAQVLEYFEGASMTPNPPPLHCPTPPLPLSPVSSRGASISTPLPSQISPPNGRPPP